MTQQHTILFMKMADASAEILSNLRMSCFFYNVDSRRHEKKYHLVLEKARIHNLNKRFQTLA